MNHARVIAVPPDPVADGLQAIRSPRLASDSLISIADIRKIFRLGRTADYQLPRRPGFPCPVPVSARCYRWRASEVDAFAAGRDGDRDELMASTAAYSGLRRGSRPPSLTPAGGTPAPGDPPLRGEVLRAPPRPPRRVRGGLHHQPRMAPRDGPGARRPVFRPSPPNFGPSARRTSRAAAWNGPSARSSTTTPLRPWRGRPVPRTNRTGQPNGGPFWH